jgi:hypothetical protein
MPFIGNAQMINSEKIFGKPGRGTVINVTVDVNPQNPFAYVTIPSMDYERLQGVIDGFDPVVDEYISNKVFEVTRGTWSIQREREAYLIEVFLGSGVSSYRIKYPIAPG